MNDGTDSTPETITADLGHDGPERVYLCLPNRIALIVENSAVRRG